MSGREFEHERDERRGHDSRPPVEDERVQRILGGSLGGETDESLKQLLADRPELGAHLEDLGEAATSLDEAAQLARSVLDEVDRETSRVSGGSKDDPHHEPIARILRERASASAEAAAMREATAAGGSDAGSRGSRWRWILLAASVLVLTWIGFESVFAPADRRSERGDGRPNAHILLGDGDDDAPLTATAPQGPVASVGEFAWASSLSLPIGGYFEVRVYEGEQPLEDRRLHTSRALEASPWILDGAETEGWRGTMCWEVVAYLPAVTDPVARSAPSVFELP